MVGAIIVKDGKIVGKGYHRLFGGLHAEVEAFGKTKGDVRGGTLYVNLEPCCHHGKQPPCVESIVEHGIKRVVLGTRDPNPLVSGKGVAYLCENGIEVRVGVLDKSCRELNEAYFKHVTTGLPLVTVKIAQTLDGKIAASNGKPAWITSESSRRLVHRMRSRHDAVLVGIGTVLADNPKLSVRLTAGASPKRIVLDSRLRIPLDANLLSDSHVKRTTIATSHQASKRKEGSIRKRGASVWRMNKEAHGGVSLPSVLRKMGEEGITSLLVEGGSEIFSGFFKANLVDKVSIFIAPKILGKGLSAIQDIGINSMAESVELQGLRRQQVGNDILLTGRISAD